MFSSICVHVFLRLHPSVFFWSPPSHAEWGMQQQLFLIFILLPNGLENKKQMMRRVRATTTQLFGTGLSVHAVERWLAFFSRMWTVLPSVADTGNISLLLLLECEQQDLALRWDPDPATSVIYSFLIKLPSSVWLATIPDLCSSVSWLGWTTSSTLTFPPFFLCVSARVCVC